MPTGGPFGYLSDSDFEDDDELEAGAEMTEGSPVV
jgi:hypothetical protein